MCRAPLSSNLRAKIFVSKGARGAPVPQRDFPKWSLFKPSQNENVRYFLASKVCVGGHENVLAGNLWSRHAVICRTRENVCGELFCFPRKTSATYLPFPLKRLRTTPFRQNSSPGWTLKKPKWCVFIVRPNVRDWRERGLLEKREVLNFRNRSVLLPSEASLSLSFLPP